MGVSVSVRWGNIMKYKKLFSPILFFCLAAGILATALISAVPNATAMAGNPVPTFDYPRDPAYLVLQYTHTYDMIENQDTTPFMRVYGDGRVLIHYPAYMKRAGDYQLQLSDAELQNLLTTLDNAGLLSLTAQAGESVQSQINATAAGQALHEVSDDTKTIIETHVSRISPKLKSGQINNRVVMSNVEAMALKHPGIPELRAMAAAEQHLQALTKDPRIVKLK